MDFLISKFTDGSLIVPMPKGFEEAHGNVEYEEEGRPTVKQSLTPKLIASLFGAVVGSAFQFGYNTGVINAPSDVIREFIRSSHNSHYNTSLTDAGLQSLWAFTVAIFAVGGCIGGISNGYFADKFGRKQSLLYNNALAATGALLMGLSKSCNSYEMLIAGRFIIGINCGLNTGLCPMYIAELSPVSIRGSVGCLFQLGVTLSLLLSQVLGLKFVFGNSQYWPLLLGFTGLFCIVQLVVLPFCPESPRYLLIKKNRKEDAEKALRALRNQATVDEEIGELLHEANMEKDLPKLFTDSSLLLPTIISIVMHLSQQLSGINAVFYYSSDILRKSGITDVENVTPLIGLTMVLMTLISIPLMEKAGRRRLHLIGLAGMFLFSILLTIALALQVLTNTHPSEFFTVSMAFLPAHRNLKDKHKQFAYLGIVSMVIFIIFFAIGPGSIPWLIVAELFHQAPRPAAMSLAVLVNWTANVAVGQGFPPLFENVTKQYTFLLFAVLLAIFWLFTFLYLPETKGKSVEEITHIFQTRHFPFRMKKSQSNESNVL